MHPQIRQIDSVRFQIDPGFVENMNVPGMFYANSSLSELVFGELEACKDGADNTGFIPAVRQIANAATLPGIVKYRSVFCRSLE